MMDTTDFTISLCKTKAAYEVKPKKRISLDLKKLKDKFEIIAETKIVFVVKSNDSGEIVVHNHGELMFKELKDEEKIKKIALEIYSC